MTPKRAGYLCRIALVYSNLDRSDDKARLEYQNIDIYSLDTQKFLWHRELPPPGLQATDIAHGYWSCNFQHQTTLQAFDFGSTEEELAIGSPDPDMEKQLAKDCEESKLPVIAGIFDARSSSGDPEANLDGMGCFLTPPLVVDDSDNSSSSSPCPSSEIIGEGVRVEMIYWREKKKPSPRVAILSTGLAVTGRGRELSSPCATV